MKITVDEKTKIAGIWITAAERNTSAVKYRIETAKANGFYPVVFVTGGEDFVAVTERLLMHNKMIYSSEQSGYAEVEERD